MWLFYTAKDLVKYYYFVPITHIFSKKKVGIQVVLKLNYNILVFLLLLLFLSGYKSLHWEILCEIREERGERTIETPSFSSGF